MVFELSLRPLLPSHFHLQLFWTKASILIQNWSLNYINTWVTIETQWLLLVFPLWRSGFMGGAIHKLMTELAQKETTTLTGWNSFYGLMCSVRGPGVLWEMAVKTVDFTNDAQSLVWSYDHMMCFMGRRRWKMCFLQPPLWGSREHKACWGPWWM